MVFALEHCRCVVYYERAILMTSSSEKLKRETEKREESDFSGVSQIIVS